MFQTRKEDMAIERKPTAFGDLRGWIDALKAHGELQGNQRRGRLEHRARHHHAAGAGARHRQGAAVQQHQGLQQAEQPLPAHLRLGAQQLPAHRNDAGPCRRRTSARAGQDRPQYPDRQHPAADRASAVRCKENIVTGNDIDLYELPCAVLEPARRRPLSPHLRRLRHQRPGHRRDECRLLSRHDARAATGCRS